MSDRITLPTFALSERAVELMAWYKSAGANCRPKFRPGFITLCYNHAGVEGAMPTFDQTWFQKQGIRLEHDARLERITVVAPETFRWRLKRNRVFQVPIELCNRFELYPDGPTEVVCHRNSSSDFAVTVNIPFGEAFPSPLQRVWHEARALEAQVFYV